VSTLPPERLGHAYLPRVIDRELDELLSELAAVAIEGPRGVGKTATALERARTVFRLDDPAQAAIMAADPGRLMAADPPVLIDEWQIVPETWDIVRRAVDAGAPAGSFILTGSSAPSQPPTHTGAGRIVSLRMRPMSLAERMVGRPVVSLEALLAGERMAIDGQTDVTLDDYAEEIVRSGFPGLRRLGPRALRAQLDGYLARIVDRDLSAAGYETRNPAALSRWLAAYAAATSTTASFETLRQATTPGHSEMPSRATTRRYVDALMAAWLIDPVPAWLPGRSHLGRLGLAPKHQLADPSLAARSVGIGVEALLKGVTVDTPANREAPFLGPLFEALVMQSLRVYAQVAEARVFHLRTKNGDREIDAIVQRQDGRALAVEVRLGRTVGDEDMKHLRWLSERMGNDLLDRVVVTTGPAAYRRTDGIAVVPASLLGP
jgi:hypothetical protein